MNDWSDLGDPIEDRDHRFVQRIWTTRVKKALKRMKMGKAMGPYGIPIEV